MMTLNELPISQAHRDALAVIMSDAWPYADQRDIGPVLEALIEEYLLRESARLGKIVNQRYVAPGY